MTSSVVEKYNTTEDKHTYEGVRKSNPRIDDLETDGFVEFKSLVHLAGETIDEKATASVLPPVSGSVFF